MKPLPVRFAEPAIDDMIALHLWVETRAGIAVADDYQARLEDHCAKLCDFPRRGSPRPELGKGIRSLTFERRISILYRVDDDHVRILRLMGAVTDMRALSLD